MCSLQYTFTVTAAEAHETNGWQRQSFSLTMSQKCPQTLKHRKEIGGQSKYIPGVSSGQAIANTMVLNMQPVIYCYILVILIFFL